MQERQETAGKALLSAQQVQDLLHVDRSTVYRMAEDGRLPAIKIGRQWRFPAGRIHALLDNAAPGPERARVIELRAVPAAPAPVSVHPDPAVATAVAAVAADLLGVMMVVTDMAGAPLTEVSNPCPWFAERRHDPALLRTCVAEWRELADDVVLEPRFHPGQLGFECARAFIRSGTSLVGMVLAGGVAPDEGAGAASEPGLYRLSAKQRRRVLAALPRIAAALSSTDPPAAAAPGTTPGTTTDVSRGVGTNVGTNVSTNVSTNVGTDVSTDVGTNVSTERNPR